ncbi:MAG: long-chain-fatty-acid--CoA ligase [Alphaproteobacteria bacterium]|nr:long-chain-fatty-acid--CoA ligase [Alphaproteobacteria bacterium]
MHGLMMQPAFSIAALIRNADRLHGRTEIVSRTIEGPIHRYNYRDAHARSRRLANALRALGVAPGDRVGTLAWNGFRHFEIYFAVSGMGAVCHTINPRLFPDQVAYIANHAADKVLFVELSFVPLVEALADRLVSVAKIVVMTDRAHMPATRLPGVLCYEEIVEAASDVFDWPALDESTASSLCYTSGTTGNPKGVLYSHRSTVIHSLASAMPDAFCLSARDTVLPVVPMFHVNAWGLPYSAPMVGAKLVFPGAALDGASLQALIAAEGVTFSAGVPTVWLGLLAHLRDSGKGIAPLRRVVIGGSAAPPAMVREFRERHDVTVLHAWGMTEMSPIGTVNTPKHGMDETPEAEYARQVRCGRPVFGVEMKIVGDGNENLPQDGVAFGELKVRGPCVCRSYFEEGVSSAHDADGWFATGDVATIDGDGYLQITDRSKDVIKSGGEWIGSIDLENIALGHPGVAEAAVVGVPHPRWDERPLLVVVRRKDAAVTRDELIRFYDGKVAKWWIPDDVVFVDALPHTATGKLLKMQLRQDFKDHRWTETR